MTVAVIGSSGQLGKAITTVFDEIQTNYIGISREDWDMDLAPSQAHELLLNIKPDIVINTAAYTAVDDAERNADSVYRINGTAVNYLSQACHHLDVPLVQISTDYVFDGRKEGQYCETDSPNPLSVYGKSKLLGEGYASTCRRHVILRTSAVFSRSSKNFVTTMLELMASKKKIHVVQDQFMGPTSSISIARALAKMLASGLIKHPRYSGIYHFAGKPHVSWFELAQYIQQEVTKSKTMIVPCSSDYFSSVAERPLNSRLSYTKIEDVFGVDECDWKAMLKMEFESNHLI